MISNSISCSSSGITDPGKTRILNEDAFLDKPDANLWAVSDGMGGHSRGDYASTLVIENLGKLAATNTIEEYIQSINRTIEGTNSELVEEAKRRHCNMIGCTVVVMVVDADYRYACLWAGDSRLYRLRDGELTQVSRDHSEVQTLVDRGAIEKEHAESHPSANIINRAVGAKEKLTLEIVQGEVKSGDKYLLCSDGLYREVTEQEVEQCLREQDQPKKIVNKLMQLALDRKAKDNVTVLAIDFY